MTYPIPNEALDDRLGWVGTSGSGKTYNAGGGVERLLASGARVVIVDPLDVWWGLRLCADGVTPSPFAPVIFGGQAADLPLSEGAGALIGETVASMAESCIVSLGGMPTKAAEQRFMLAFLESLYRQTAGAPVHIIFDEADLWAPQNAGKEGGNGPKLQSLMEQIVRRGRIKGFIPWLITQRPAVLSKDVLSQVDGLVAFKLTSSQDRDAIGGWIEGQADRAQGREILGSLPTMQRGQGVVWVPGRGILATASFPAKETFDSSRTPKRGEKRERRDLKPLNLDKLKDRLAAIEEEAKANDPPALKAEVARLTRELAKVQRAVGAPPAPVTVIANKEEIEVAREEGRRAGIAIGIARARAAIDTLRVDVTVGAIDAQHILRTRDPKIAVVVGPTSDGVSGPQQRILDALAWWEAFGIARPTNDQLAFVSGYSPTSSGYKNPKSALRTAGLIEYPTPGTIVLTDAGRAKANAPAAPTTRDELHRRVNERLSGPQRAILAPAMAAYPDSISNENLAGAAGYSPTSSGYKNPKSSLRTLSLVDYPSTGMIRAADWLFPA